MKDLRAAFVPMYDELSVKAIYKEAIGDPELRLYFPDTTDKGRLPNREYFYNVLSTLQHEYLMTLIEHANQLRN